MAEAAPYLFDRTFEVTSKGSESAEASAALKLQEDWERKLADACCKSFEEGEAAGKAEALRQLEAETLEQVKQLVTGADKIFRAVDSECEQVRRNAIEIASTAAELLSGELISRHPTLNTEALFRDALEHACDAPHIAITVNDAHADQIQKTVAAVSAERGFAGKLVVIGDPETKIGDCSLQWADGGIALDTGKTRAEIHKLVRNHLDRPTNGSEAVQHDPATRAEPSIVTASALEAGSGDTP